jgi:hypothetical protein
MPETVIAGYNLEIVGGVGHAHVHARRGDVSAQANLSECRHSSIGLDELRVAALMRDITDLAEIGDCLVLRFRPYSATPALPEQRHAEVKSPSVAQAACHLGLRYCRSLGGRRYDRFTVADASFATSPRIRFSLCDLIECMVRWNQARIARDGTFGSRLLLPSPSDGFVGPQAHRNTTACRLYGDSPVCLVA